MIFAKKKNANINSLFIMEEKMDISIITPIYYGNKYLDNYLKMIAIACENKENVEVIWVNDSPEEKIKYDINLVKNFTLRIIENQKNMGIQKSRINGLLNAKGKYILFLDQDDEITQNCLFTQFEKAEGADIVLGNGFYIDNNGKHRIYKNNFSQKFSIKKSSMIKIRDLIISPGQCLIKKESIPDFWINNPLKNNGTDDYLLWLLMLNNNVNIRYNYECVYIHNYTGENLSLFREKMFNSQKEMLELLRKNNDYDKSDLKKLNRTILYKYNYKKSRKNFILESLKNFDIFIYNILYKILWKGYILSKDIQK